MPVVPFLFLLSCALWLTPRSNALTGELHHSINSGASSGPPFSSPSSTSLTAVDDDSRRHDHSRIRTTRRRAATSTTYFRLFSARHPNEQSNSPTPQRSLRPTIDRPSTQTMFDAMGPKSIPAKPKIVVLGATGRIGRRVVKQLLELPLDMTIVAFCRDYEKALKVLYDDVLLTVSSFSRNTDDTMLQHHRKRGPVLQIVEGDLVPDEELPGYAKSHEVQEEETVWLQKAESAAAFYGSSVEDDDNRDDNGLAGSDMNNINESLELAIRDATTVISCVGSVRKTNIWTDFLARPVWRILRPDVSSWCRDARHPYYVHYVSTRKALGIAEREQLRREAAAATLAEAEGMNVKEDDLYVPRIRFIRVSDLNVGQNPWNLIPLVTNVIHSVVFRYQEMAERLLDASSLVETVVLRPGDLVDDERDANTTAVQVCSSGTVPSPSRVGREDVATLVVEAALFVTPNETSSTADSGVAINNDPIHYTFATRWVGEELDPYPSQGRMRDGHQDASVSFRRAVKAAHRANRAAARKERLKVTMRKTKMDTIGIGGSGRSWDAIRRVTNSLDGYQSKRQVQRRSTRPHGICVAVPVYLLLGLMVKALLPSLQYVPGGQEWILPAVRRFNEWTWMGLSYSMSKMLALLSRKKPVHISL